MLKRENKDFQVNMISILYSGYEVEPNSDEEKILKKFGITFIRKKPDPKHLNLIDNIINLLTKTGKYQRMSNLKKEKELREEFMDSGSKLKIAGFEKMVAPLLEWLEKPEHYKGELYEGRKTYTYPQMAQAIRNGEEYGVQYALEYLEAQRQLYKEIRDKEKNAGFQR